MANEKPKGGSGEHPAVKAFRAKLDSIEETTLEQLKDLNRKLDEELEKHPSSRPAKKDSRREPDDDERKEEEIPIDVVGVPGKTLPVPAPDWDDITPTEKEKP